MEFLETRDNTTSLIADKPSKNKRYRCKFFIIVISIIVTIVVSTAVILIITNVVKSNNDRNKISGTYGKWSSYGGSPTNQQFAPKESNVIINKNNIKNMSLQCAYSISNVVYDYNGYITIDEDNYGYVTDAASNAFKIDLDSCTIIWIVNIAEILGYIIDGQRLYSRHTATLFQNSNGDKGILFGAPNLMRVGISAFDGCWAVALNIKDGSLLWSTNLGNGIESYDCCAHGFMIDTNDHYAYGGMSVPTSRNLLMDSVPLVAIARGKMYKLDINTGDIIHSWHSIDKDKFAIDLDNVNVSYEYQYRGASMWHMPAVIDNYLVFGTGNLFSYPKYIEECLFGNLEALPLENAHVIDACGVNRSVDERVWRCLEKGVYPDSFIVLNKHTFELLAAVPVQGVDGEDAACRDGLIAGCMKIQGPDSDLVAIATYQNPNNRQLYAAAAQKSGHFYVFEIPSGKIVIAKKVGPWSIWGGSQWSLAVDPINMIAIVTITGGVMGSHEYRTVLADGTELCNVTGSVHAIDLNNGDTIWQMASPWGVINNCNDPIYDEYKDYAVNASCETNVKDATETVINVEIPPIDESERDDIASAFPGLLAAPVTIVNDMVLIPTGSGDVFVHDIFNGTYIHTLQCPSRELIKGGVTVVEDRIVFHCGSGTGTVVSMKL
eukprot:257771_1